MTQEVFDCYQAFAVPEPHPAAELPPPALTAPEAALYRYLQRAERGRLEQEFIPPDQVCRALQHLE